MAGKLYVLVRADLTVPQQVVQSCHVIEAWCAKFGAREDVSNQTSVLVTVKDGKWLQHWKDKLDNSSSVPTYAIFVEPDLDNEYTALACYTEDERLFSKLPLWNPTVQ